MNPAKEEQAAPTITAIAECIPRPSHTNTTKTDMNINKYVYSVFIKANAPLCI